MLALASTLMDNHPDVMSEPTTPGQPPVIQVRLRDGSTAELRPVTRDDRDLLLTGLSQMSEQSRFARFGSGRSRLSESEVRYLTDVDQVSHVAWGAMIDDNPAGVGRYIVDEDGQAEIAVTVVDHYQGRGLGRALFDALIASARASGLQVLWFSIEPWNRAVVRMMEDFEVVFDEADGMLSGRVEVATIPPADLEAEYVELLDSCRRGWPDQPTGPVSPPGRGRVRPS
jgi:RimJ/RimL family protein N-acetyltransferase